MNIELPDDKIRHILMDLTLANTVYADVVKNAIEQALATEKADTKYVDELIAIADDTTCYNAYQFITGVENRRRLLNHLNRLQSVEVTRCVRCNNMTNYKQTLCSDCKQDTVQYE